MSTAAQPTGSRPGARPGPLPSPQPDPTWDRPVTDPARAASTKAALLRALHHRPPPLVLPNAWDVASARALVAAGFPVVATSSAAVAATLGFGDGEQAPVGAVLDAVAAIAEAVEVPVTADLERGYGLPAAELVERLVATGAAGVNLEDSDPRTHQLVEPEAQAAFLAAVRQAATGSGVDLVVNARVDTYLYGVGDPRQRLADAGRRAARYLEAGADCVYPILLGDAEGIRALVESAGGPVNILFRGGASGTPSPGAPSPGAPSPGTPSPGTPSLAELARLGVARISFGAGLYQAQQRALTDMLTAIRAGRDPFA
jgi:2-methylisocitrate lyase-like PEP mutase family enzyme